jgi:hypothetical protein
MSGTIGYDDLRAGTVRQVAQLMAAAAITAPKSGGQLFLAGKLAYGSGIPRINHEAGSTTVTGEPFRLAWRWRCLVTTVTFEAGAGRGDHALSVASMTS